jgi:Kef-type K+ transport system membrane component KefB
MNPDVSFAGLLVVVAVAFVGPIALALTSLRRVPAAVMLILAGIVLGPSVAGVVAVDLPIQILAVLGLAFLLFLAGLEVEVHDLRGRRLRVALVSFAASFGLALLVGAGMAMAGLLAAPVLVAVIIVGTSLGIVIPVLKDAGEAGGSFGQLVIAAASVADFGAILLLSVLFARDADNAAVALFLVGLFILLIAAFVVAIQRTERSRRLEPILRQLQDSTAQIRVRGAVVLLIALVALAESLGLELILGAFIAGAILKLVDADETMTHPVFRQKLEAIGYGVFVPVFFVATGLRFDLGALLSSPASLAQVPLFVAALLVVRGLPAVLLRDAGGARRVVGAGLLQATLLPIAPTQIGLELGLISPDTGAALITAGLVSAVVFPTLALALLRQTPATIRSVSAMESNAS